MIKDDQVSVIVFLEYFNNGFVIPAPTLSNHGCYQLRRNVVESFAHDNSEAKLIFFREPGTSTF